jgi:hypothetical protein
VFSREGLMVASRGASEMRELSQFLGQGGNNVFSHHAIASHWGFEIFNGLLVGCQ